jgi:hypothetical protein
MTLHSKLIPAVAAICIATVALASPGVVLVSPSLSAANAGNAPDCRIVNLSGSDQLVGITSYDSTAAIVGSNTVNVVSGGWAGVSLTFENGPGAGYCKFSVPGGRRVEDFRASISVIRFGFGTLASLPAY